MDPNYDFTSDDLTTLLLRRFYPERTDRESTIIRDWLRARGSQYDRFSFSVRVGTAIAPDPSHLPGVQENTVRSSRKRIDILAWQGDQPSIIEVKERITHYALGQVQTYRTLWMEEHPDAREPILVVIGRYPDEDAVRVLQAHGVTVLVYLPDDADGPTTPGRLSADNNPPA